MLTAKAIVTELTIRIKNAHKDGLSTAQKAELEYGHNYYSIVIDNGLIKLLNEDELQIIAITVHLDLGLIITLLATTIIECI